MKTPSSVLMTITPHQARLWLEKNTMNRPYNTDNLNTLIKEMSKKNFYITGESIKIADDGTLLDGQYRLRAIVETGTAVKMFVTQGLPKEAFKYIDTGRVRQASDVLAIEGIKNPSKIAAIVKFVIRFKKGEFLNIAHKKAKGSKKITNAEVSEFTNKYLKSLQDSYGFGFGKGRRLISGVYVSGLHYIFKDLDEKYADDFINKFVTGDELKAGSPIHQLRERFVMDAKLKRKMKNIERLALVCKAWNLYRQNKTVVILRWDYGKDQFPKPI